MDFEWILGGFSMDFLGRKLEYDFKTLKKKLVCKVIIKLIKRVI